MRFTLIKKTNRGFMDGLDIESEKKKEVQDGSWKNGVTIIRDEEGDCDRRRGGQGAEVWTEAGHWGRGPRGRHKLWSWHQHVSGTEVQTEHVLGLPWWLSAKESACEGRGHGFKPWCRKIPHAVEQLSPYTTTPGPVLQSLGAVRPRACTPQEGKPQLEKSPSRRPSAAKTKYII